MKFFSVNIHQITPELYISDTTKYLWHRRFLPRSYFMSLAPTGTGVRETIVFFNYESVRDEAF